VRRREFISLVGGAVVWPVVARAQQPAHVRRIGILMPYPRSDTEVLARVQIFRQELARLGWSEGGNVQFDERWSTDNMDLVRADAVSLVALNPDVILISGDRVIPVFTKLTSSVPIVVAITTNPMASGAVESLARPGHNVTGFSNFELSVFGKLLEALKRIAPGVTRVGIIYNPDNPNGADFSRSFETSAGQLAVQPITLPVHGLTDVERAIASMAEQPNGGILFAPDLTIVSLRTQVVAIAARYRVPAIYPDDVFVKAGGLISYGADRVVIFRQSAGYVDRILRGERPGDLPFQQPTQYRLVINLKTANALGLTVPPTLLATADEVIE
jgi:putative tryptophan/tyrosine transport system substrate-binding protein